MMSLSPSFPNEFTQKTVLEQCTRLFTVLVETLMLTSESLTQWVPISKH